MVRIFVLGKLAALGADLLRRQLACPFEMTVVRDPRDVGDYMEAFAAADVIVGWGLTPELIRHARSLKLLQVAGAGYDGLPLDLLPPHVTVANTFHHEAAIAEYVLTAMLWFTRRPAECDRRLRNGNWQGSCIWGGPPEQAELCGRRVLLIGLGHIAREVAARAKAFNMYTIGVSRKPRSGVVDDAVAWDAWEDRLPEADFVVPCCPLTPETEGLIGERQFERMKPAAVLINAARGRIVQEEALYRALKEGRIGGAAIDVWYQYPAEPDEVCLPSKFPFHELLNVLMTPHSSGWTWRTVEGRAQDIADNINRLAAGRPLKHVVKPAQ